MERPKVSLQEHRGPFRAGVGRGQAVRILCMRRPPKLFASHGGEVAHKLLGALERDGLVSGFIDRYVAANNRPGLKSNPGRYRELQGTLGREALLAMVAQVTSELPRHL